MRIRLVVLCGSVSRCAGETEVCVNVRSPPSFAFAIWRLPITSPTVEGASAFPAISGWNNGSRNPRRVLGAPWTRISLMVMGIDDWSTIYTRVRNKHLKIVVIRCFTICAIRRSLAMSCSCWNSGFDSASWRSKPGSELSLPKGSRPCYRELLKGNMKLASLENVPRHWASSCLLPSCAA